MVTLSPASVVVIPFLFSDLSGTKLRPAVVLAETGHGDWLLCQITSNPYIDPSAIQRSSKNLEKGALAKLSFARPMKLFTANVDLIEKRVAILDDETFSAILQRTIDGLAENMPK